MSQLKIVEYNSNRHGVCRRSKSTIGIYSGQVEGGRLDYHRDRQEASRRK